MSLTFHCSLACRNRIYLDLLLIAYVCDAGLRPTSFPAQTAAHPYQQPQYPPASLPSSQYLPRQIPTAQQPAAHNQPAGNLSQFSGIAQPSQPPISPNIVPPNAALAGGPSEANGAQYLEHAQRAQQEAAAPDVSSMLAILRNVGALPGLNLSLGDASAAVAAATSAASSNELQAAPGSASQEQQQPHSAAEVDSAMDGEPSVSDLPADQSHGAALSAAQEGGAADGRVADLGPVLAGDAGSSEAPDIESNLFALLGQLAPAGQ